MSEALDLRGKLGLERERKNTVSYLTPQGFIRVVDNGMTIRPFHLEQTFQRSDRERTALLKGEKSLIGLETILDIVVENEDVFIRVRDYLWYVFRALGVERRSLGMPRAPEAE